MRRQPVPQLAGIRRQVHRDLLQSCKHLARRAGVADELAGKQPLTLPRAADDCPQEQVGHVDGYRLRQARKLGRVGPDLGGVAHAIVGGEDFEGANDLVWACQ